MRARIASAAALAARIDENSPACARRRLDQGRDLVELGLDAGPVAAGRRQVRGDVEDARLGVLERRADVQTTPRGVVAQAPGPGHRFKRSTDGQGRRRQHRGGSSNTRPRSRPATDSGATRSTGRVLPAERFSS